MSAGYRGGAGQARLGGHHGMSHILYQAFSNPCGFGSATLEKTRNARSRT
jgi:hypothetical protein